MGSTEKMRHGGVMECTIKELQALYDARKNDDDTLSLCGCEFYPKYLKYLLEYLNGRKAKTVHLMPHEWRAK